MLFQRTNRRMIFGVSLAILPMAAATAQPSACSDIGATNCQFPLGDGYVYLSDLSQSDTGGVVSADDFVPEGDTIETVCVWGTYLDPTGPGASVPVIYGCTGTVKGDQFRVRVFLDGGEDGDPLTTPGLPGAVVGQSIVSTPNITMSPLSGSFFEQSFTGVDMNSFQLTLDTPITNLQTGVRHWIEVADYTPDPIGNQCHWHWAQYIPTSGDGYCASGVSPHFGDPDDLLGRPSFYVNGSDRGGSDLAFCLSDSNGPVDFTTPPVDTAACWTCGECAELRSCSVTTLRSCMLQGGEWDREDPTCSGPNPEPAANDFCGSLEQSRGVGTCGDGNLDPGEGCDDGNTMPLDGCDENCMLECPPSGAPIVFGISAGLHGIDNTCATRDGPDVVRGENGDFRIDGDLWFAYTASVTGIISVSTCATQTAWTQDGYTGFNSAIAVYHEFGTRCADGINAGQPCVCPGSQAWNKCYDTVQCPGSGLCRNECPCPGPANQISPWQFGRGSDEGCNGLADQGGARLEVTAFPNECFLIQVGSDSDPASQTESTSRGRGLLEIHNYTHELPPLYLPEPEMGVNAEGELVPWRKPRVLSFQGTGPPRPQAVRVTFNDMPPLWEFWNGVQLFVQEPWIGSSSANKGFTDPPDPGDPGIQLAELGCDPFYADWSDYGVVHIIHPAIAPSRMQSPTGPIEHAAEYAIQVTDSTCAVTDESCYTDPIHLYTSGWSDLVSLVGGEYLTPDDTISIADTLASLSSFTGQPGAPRKISTELTGATTGPDPWLDGKISISDLVFVLSAFQGDHYPPGFENDNHVQLPDCP